MKVAFDEHVPPALFKAFDALREETDLEGCELCTAKSYSPGAGAQTDIPWIEAFAQDGGNIIISGDKRIKGNLFVQRAINEAGVIAFFLPPAWNQWDMYTRTAFILKWWKRIVLKAREVSEGTMWSIPAAWTSSDFENVPVPE